jgi:hypothetical protein
VLTRKDRGFEVILPVENHPLPPFPLTMLELESESGLESELESSGESIAGKCPKRTMIEIESDSGNISDFNKRRKGNEVTWILDGGGESPGEPPLSKVVTKGDDQDMRISPFESKDEDALTRMQLRNQMIHSFYKTMAIALTSKRTTLPCQSSTMKKHSLVTRSKGLFQILRMNPNLFWMTYQHQMMMILIILWMMLYWRKNLCEYVCSLVSCYSTDPTQNHTSFL